MGTIDFALGRDTIAMQLYLLALVLPLAAAGFDAPQMMQMMQMMNAAKGWGSQQQGGNMGGNMGGNVGGNMGGNMGGNQGVMQQQMQQQQQQQQWQGMTNSADYEAYLKWCQENKMAQWKGWEQRMKMSSNFEHLGYEIMEMKMKYYYMVTFEFLKFCKCQDKTSQIQAFFSHEGMSSNKADYEEFDLADLGITEAQSTDPNAVARALVNLSAQDQIKAYFYGLATDMCKGAQAYFDQVELWEKQYNFLEKLA